MSNELYQPRGDVARRLSEIEIRDNAIGIAADLDGLGFFDRIKFKQGQSRIQKDQALHVLQRTAEVQELYFDQRVKHMVAVVDTEMHVAVQDQLFELKQRFMARVNENLARLEKLFTDSGAALLKGRNASIAGVQNDPDLTDEDKEFLEQRSRQLTERAVAASDRIFDIHYQQYEDLNAEMYADFERQGRDILLSSMGNRLSW